MRKIIIILNSLVFVSCLDRVPDMRTITIVNKSNKAIYCESSENYKEAVTNFAMYKQQSKKLSAPFELLGFLEKGKTYELQESPSNWESYLEEYKLAVIIIPRDTLVKYGMDFKKIKNESLIRIPLTIENLDKNHWSVVYFGQ